MQSRVLPFWLTSLSCLVFYTGSGDHVLAQNRRTAVDVEVVDAQGRRHEGEFQRADGVSLFLKNDGISEIKITDLIEVRFPQHKRKKPRGPIVLLENGDRLGVKPLTTNGDFGLETAWTEFPAWPQLTLPLETIQGILFSRPNDRLARERIMNRLIDDLWNDDRAILQNGDEVVGEFVKLSEKQLALTVAEIETNIDRNGVRAISFNTELISFPKPEGHRAVILLVDDSRISVTKLRIEKGIASGKLIAGGEFHVPLDSIATIHFLDGNATCLSDIEPADYKFTPYLSTTWPVQKDRNVRGGLLTLGGKTYVKGLGLHSQCVVRYQLDRKYESFHAIAGIDNGAGRAGQVILRLLVDGKEVASESLSHADDPWLIPPIDLRGKHALTIKVEFGDRADVQDHLNLCNAVLVKPVVE